MPNRLKQETSPYLLQHAENPVDWYPWCDEAIQRAVQEQRPIFLSVGYSACHWCHVMEHESFEDEELARTLNQNFICIKVDREERPDIDQIYMRAVQMMTGRGGWPMSVFLTPELHPFFGGTYWPPRQRMGMPGFDQVLAAVLDAWQNRKDQAIQQAESMTARMASVGFPVDDEDTLDESILQRAADELSNTFDSTYGGFGGAPKFPRSMDLQLLLRYAAKSGRTALGEIVETSLDRMAHGGIYDHLGGGFARYSTDVQWLVPHFEKMLYDNALLANAYLDSYIVTNNTWHARVVRETLEYVRRDMTGPDGGFYSAEDADSEGVEGKFYVWSVAEIEATLDQEAATEFCRVYGVSPQGNFEGKNILNLQQPLAQVAEANGESPSELADRLADSAARLKTVRDARIAPGKDDKVIVSWNGLMLDAFARAARQLECDEYRTVAVQTANFLHDQLWDGAEAELKHSWRNGRASQLAFLDDYTALSNGLVSLYEATFDVRWLNWAFELIEVVLQRFRDSADGGALFYTADNGEKLITRPKDLQDSSVPSGNALAVSALLRLAALSHREELRDAAMEILQAASGLLKQAPAAAGQMLMGLDSALGPMLSIAVVGRQDDPTTKSLLAEINRRFLPRSVVALNEPRSEVASPSLQSLFQDRDAIDGKPTVYLCVGQTCQAPIHDPAALATALDEMQGGS